MYGGGFFIDVTGVIEAPLRSMEPANWRYRGSIFRTMMMNSDF